MKSSSASQAPQVNSSKTGVDGHADGLPGRLAAGQCQANRGRPVGNVQLRAVLTQGVAQPVDSLGRGRRRVGLDEDRVAQGHLEVVESVAHQGLERHGVDIIGLDAFHDLVVEIDGLLVRQAEQHVAKAGIEIAAGELEVDLAEPEPAAEIDAAGPALEGGVIGLDGPRPVARPFQVEPMFQGDLGILGSLRSGRRGIGGGAPSGGSAQCDRAGQSRPARTGATRPGNTRAAGA